MKYTVNGTIITKPFQSSSIKVEDKGGFAVLSQKYKFEKLEVVIGNIQNTIHAGDYVYVPAELMKQHWAIRKFTLEDGQEVILVPEAEIKMIEVKMS
jgi:hypothetical protein